MLGMSFCTVGRWLGAHTRMDTGTGICGGSSDHGGVMAEQEVRGGPMYLMQWFSMCTIVKQSCVSYATALGPS